MLVDDCANTVDYACLFVGSVRCVYATVPIFGACAGSTGVEGTRALDALARGGGLYWGTTSSSSMGIGGGAAPLLLERVGALARGVVALGALAALGFPRPKGYVGVSLALLLGVPMLNWGTTVSIMGVGPLVAARIAPIEPGGGGGGGPTVTGTPATGWS